MNLRARSGGAVMLTVACLITGRPGGLFATAAQRRGADDPKTGAPPAMAAPATTHRESGTLRIGGWITYWDFTAGLDVARRRSDLVKDIFFFAAHLSPEGEPVISRDDLDYRATAAAIRVAGGTPWVTVVNDVIPGDGQPVFLKDPGVVHRIINDSERTRKHVRHLVRMATDLEFAGVDIDYENLQAEDRDLFSTFILELAESLKKENLLLSVTVQPKVRESRSQGPGAADWSVLCRSADRLQIMLYNLYSRQTGPGPMATRAWIQEVMRHAGTRCDPSRIVPVLKTSGMNWGADAVRDITYQEAVALAARHGVPVLRTEEDRTPHFSYRSEAGEHTVFFEDAVSLRVKAEFLADLGFPGIVLWSLGKEDPGFWRAGGD